VSAEFISRAYALRDVRIVGLVCLDGDGVELCVELVDSLHSGCKPLVVECSVVGEREGGAA